eukprot:8053482-Karenia_brevis.AAC.1
MCAFSDEDDLQDATDAIDHRAGSTSDEEEFQKLLCRGEKRLAVGLEPFSDSDEDNSDLQFA